MGLEYLGSGRYLLTEGDEHRSAYARTEGDRVWVWLDGRVYLVEPATAAPATRRHDDTGALMAPMPATVVSVRVAPGDRVARGDVLITLEAMKMELPIIAPRDGIVGTISCRPGDLVQPGVALVELG